MFGAGPQAGWGVRTDGYPECGVPGPTEARANAPEPSIISAGVGPDPT